MTIFLCIWFVCFAALLLTRLLDEVFVDGSFPARRDAWPSWWLLLVAAPIAFVLIVAERTFAFFDKVYILRREGNVSFLQAVSIIIKNVRTRGV